MKISVLICTHNRSKNLKGILDSLLVQQKPAQFQYEIVVVDNNSTDNTKSVIDAYKSKFKGALRYCFEPRQGKSYALNTGIKIANFDIIATTDDDAIADKYWLYQTHKAFDEHDVDMVGGKVLLLHEEPFPPWLAGKTLGVLGWRDYGEKVRVISGDSAPFCGLNMAFKKECSIRFREGLGVKRGDFFISGGEDTQFFLDFLSRGKKMLYQPKSVIYHKVSLNRLNKSYFRKWFFYYAQADFLRNQLLNKSCDRLSPGAKNSVIIGTTKALMAYIKWLFLKPKYPDKYFERELGVFHYLGLATAKLRSINSKI